MTLMTHSAECIHRFGGLAGEENVPPNLARAMYARVFLIAISVALLIAASTTSATSAPSPRLDDEEGCLEAVPDEYSVASVTDDGHESVLDVHVLLDDVPLSDGQGVMKAAARPYSEINVKLEPTFEEVSFPPATTTAEGNGTLDPEVAFQLAREQTGGYRPHGTDVVYVMTSKDLVSSGAAGGAVAGQADCIGGVRYPEFAFAVGETEPDPSGDYWFGSIVTGHEIGHLLGAHHHYANCAQGNPDDIVEYFTSCTLMFNDVGLISRRFSTVEGAVVRGHMLAYADETPTGPPEPAARELTLKVRNGRAQGKVDTNVGGCQDLVDVSIQRKENRRWVERALATTVENGSYKIRLSQPRGTYRAVVAETVGHDGETWRTCERAVSKAVTIKS
jgi:hypothetical protein